MGQNTEYDTIIQNIIDMKIVDKIGRSYQKYLNDEKDDYLQDLWLKILEMPEDKIIKLYNSNELVYYLLAVTKNDIFNKYSTFNKKYKKIIDEPLIWYEKTRQ